MNKLELFLLELKEKQEEKLFFETLEDFERYNMQYDEAGN